MSLLHLEPLLQAYSQSQDSAEREQLESQLWEKHGQSGAIMVLDMGRFSLTTQEHGIVYYLSLVAQMQNLVTPLLEQHQGRLVKFEADNCFAWFEDVQPAISAALAIQRAAADKPELVVKFGIDFGHFLMFDEDIWGDPINCASKLGEDLAMADEILVSARAIQRLKDPRDLVEFNVSNIVIEAARF